MLDLLLKTVRTLTNLVYLDPYSTCFFKAKNINDYDIGFEDDVNSAIECQGKCTKKIKCQSFVYSSDYKRCWFKRKKVEEVSLTPVPNLLSGPKFCSK